MEARQGEEVVNRGAWTAEEDRKLAEYVHAHGPRRWKTAAVRAGLNRCGKSCRLRWLNYLRPNIKRGNITEAEEDLILRLHKLLGNRWSLIAGRLPGRTDNEIKNYWNSHLSKKTKRRSKKPELLKKKQRQQEQEQEEQTPPPLPPPSSAGPPPTVSSSPPPLEENEDNGCLILENCSSSSMRKAEEMSSSTCCFEEDDFEFFPTDGSYYENHGGGGELGDWVDEFLDLDSSGGGELPAWLWNSDDDVLNN